MQIPSNKNDVYPKNRKRSFAKIIAATKNYKFCETDDSALLHGDSLEILKLIDDNSIDLVLTDPPYHSTKKKNIYGDADFIDDTAFIDWIAQYAVEWKRILRPNGSLYLFCSSDMAPFLYVRLNELMNMHNIVTWTKPNEPGYDGWKQKMKKTSLRRWYPHSERIIFCTPAVEGNLKRSPLGHFLKQCRLKCEMTANELTELAGAYGKVNNGGAVSNWETGRNIPSPAQYEKICEAFIGTSHIQLMPAYEDVVRPFDIDPTDYYVDAWNHINVRQYKGKHPAEKPADLLELIITTSSYKGDVVLDAFSGSGATLSAASKLGRRSIGIEIDDHWIRYAADRLLLKKGGAAFGDHPRARKRGGALKTPDYRGV